MDPVTITITFETVVDIVVFATLVAGLGLAVYSLKKIYRMSMANDRTYRDRTRMLAFHVLIRKYDKDLHDELVREYNRTTYDTHMAAYRSGDDPIKLYPKYASLFGDFFK